MIPVYTRRAQGRLQETIVVRGAWKKRFPWRADLILAVGFRFWSGEHFGELPTRTPTPRTCRSTPRHRGRRHVPADIPVVATRSRARPAVTRAEERALGGGQRRGGTWLAEVDCVRTEFDRALVAQAEEGRGAG